MLLPAVALAAWGAGCAGTVYLTIDTGWSSHAEAIKAILEKQHVRATFFIANEVTFRGDRNLDDSWREFWRSLAAEGNAFGSHTWRHGTIRGDLADGRVNYVVAGHSEPLTRAGLCEELRKVDTRFRELTGRGLDPFWRAPGGHTSPDALAYAKGCGFQHVGWAAAGFLGDELPSDKYPNRVLLRRALAGIRDGDILMMHLGIHSRKDPWAPELDALITGLKAKGFCFGTIPEKFGHVPLGK